MARRLPNRWPNDPRPGHALTKLKNEVLALRPTLSPGGFGMLGDAAHAARKSDHNPRYVARVKQWIVTGVDVPLRVGDGNRKFAQRMVEHGRAGRLGYYGYVISDNRIASRRTGWRWVHYGGPGLDPHTGHVHVSFGHSPKSFDNSKPYHLTKRDVY